MHDDADLMDADGVEQRSWNDFADDRHSESETIEDVVRDTVDRLVAITILNTAPFVVNMLTAVPGNASNNDSKMSNNSFGAHVSRRMSDSDSHSRSFRSIFSSLEYIYSEVSFHCFISTIDDEQIRSLAF
jgi:hypothetical protein